MDAVSVIRQNCVQPCVIGHRADCAKLLSYECDPKCVIAINLSDVDFILKASDFRDLAA